LLQNHLTQFISARNELIEIIPKQLADIDLRQISIYQCTNSIDPHISESIPPRPLGTKITLLQRTQSDDFSA
jgi:hypothetical protein